MTTAPVPPSRVLTCIGCGDDVEVFEIPSPWIDPARYRCRECVTLVKPAQLRLVDAPTPARAESPTYDPSQAAIPF